MRLSAVIPTYNEARFIDRCLESVTNQTVSLDEVIVVDGGSTDGTVEVARRYTDKVYVIGRRGIWRARAYGTEVATGDVVFSMDADTVYDRRYVETLSSRFSEGVSCVGGRVEPLYPGILQKFYCRTVNAFSSRYSLFPGTAMAFRREAYKLVGGYKPVARGEDWFLSYSLRSVGRTVYEPEAVAYTDVDTGDVVRIAGFVAAPPTTFAGYLAGVPEITAGGLGYLLAELVSDLVYEPTPVHHSHIGLAGLAAATWLRDRVGEGVRRLLAGASSGVVVHHIATEDVDNPSMLAPTLAAFASLITLYLIS